MKQYVDEFINRALSAGVPQEKIAALLNQADVIASRNSGQSKIAASYLDTAVDNLLSSTGFEKTSSSVAFTHGLLKTAIDTGATPAEALNITKSALEQAQTNLDRMNKVATIQQDPALYSWAEGFVKAAVDAGYSEQEAWNGAINLIEQEKAAAHGSGEMFKHDTGGAGPQGAGPQGAGPGAAPGGDPTGGAGGVPSEDDVMALLQSLPPEEQQKVLQEFLAMISGGQQGGPAGAAAGGPAMPPQGGGAAGGLPPTGPGGQ